MSDDKPERPAAQVSGTGIVKMHETDVAAQLEIKKLEIADRDKARDDRRATVRTVLLWSTAFVGTIGALVLLVKLVR